MILTLVYALPVFLLGIVFVIPPVWDWLFEPKVFYACVGVGDAINEICVCFIFWDLAFMHWTLS